MNALYYLGKLVCRQCEIIFNLKVKLDVVQNNILIQATGKHFILIVEKRLKRLYFPQNTNCGSDENVI
jgi:hypothetical protein